MVQKNSLIRILPFITLVAVVIVMAAATVIEKTEGSVFASRQIYSTWWFTGIWCLLALTSAARIIAYGMHRQLALLLLHVSMTVILLGALTTHITSRKGYLHLRCGEKAMLYTEMNNAGERHMARLPFMVTLNDFKVENYEGTTTHSDYASHVTFTSRNQHHHETISMNNIAVVEGYRFYQTSFDTDMKGSLMTVTYDPYGTAITYVGYALLIVSAVLVLSLRTPRIKHLCRRLTDSRSVMIAMLLTFAGNAMAAQTPVIARDDAERAGRQPVVYNGRVCPMNTLAHDFCLKLTGKITYKGLSAEQLLLSLPMAPDAWSTRELLKVKNKALREQLGISSPLARPKDFYDINGRYLLEGILSREMAKAADDQDKQLIRAVYDADEQISLIDAAITGKLIEHYKGNNPPGEMKTSAEILYNSYPLTTISFVACFIMAAVVLLAAIRLKGRYVTTLKVVVLTAVSAFQLAIFLLRWYISGNIPLSNGFETMAFVSLSTSLLTLAAAWALRRQTFVSNTVTIGGLTIAGLTMLTTHLSEMSPQITSLMPVLHSPWLTTHVTLIMISYSLFAFTAAIAGVNLVKNDMRLDALNRLILYPAEMCLAVGIFLGAIWANQSWGAYWSWDPKEVWALITMLIYCIPLHTVSLPVMQKPRVLNVYLILAFLSILMTYFGVNYLLGGMHSYAM